MSSELTVAALRGIRLQFQESTSPEEWPEACAAQLCLLGDVAAALGATDAQAEEVLGAEAWQYLRDLTGAEL